MRSVTLLQLKEDVRTRYELPTYTTSTRVTTAQVTRLINLSLQQFYAMLAECYGDDYFASSATITTTADFGVSSLPQDFYKLLSASWRKTDEISVRLKKATADDMMRTNLIAKDWNTHTPRYRITAQALQWSRVPSDSYTVDLWYVPIQPDLDDDADTFSAGPGWDEWIVLDVCRRIAESEQKDIQTWVAMRNDTEQRIRAQAPERDESESLQVRDVMYRSTSRLSTQELRDAVTDTDCPWNW